MHSLEMGGITVSHAILLAIYFITCNYTYMYSLLTYFDYIQAVEVTKCLWPGTLTIYSDSDTVMSVMSWIYKL